MQNKNQVDKKYPTLQQVKKIYDSIKIDSIIDERNRVIFAILLLTGIRIEALSTLSLGCFDPEKMIFDQDPRKGVKTKFGKRIITYAIKFDNQLVNYIKDWYNKLIEMGYGINDPFIPGAKSNRYDGLCFMDSVDLNKKFIRTGRLREIIKKHCEKAGYLDFTPHSFRHAHIALANKLAKTGEDFKAISMNIGHENIETTFNCYAQLTQSQIENTISYINDNIDIKN